MFAVGTINDPTGYKDAFIVRTDPDFSNPIYYHWGGQNYDDIFSGVRLAHWGSIVYVMGSTRSFNG